MARDTATKLRPLYLGRQHVLPPTWRQRQAANGVAPEPPAGAGPWKRGPVRPAAPGGAPPAADGRAGDSEAVLAIGADPAALHLRSARR